MSYMNNPVGAPPPAYGANAPYGAPAPFAAQGSYAPQPVSAPQDVYLQTQKPPTTYQQPKPKEKGFFARVLDFLLGGPIGALAGGVIGLAANATNHNFNDPDDEEDQEPTPAPVPTPGAPVAGAPGGPMAPGSYPPPPVPPWLQPSVPGAQP